MTTLCEILKNICDADPDSYSLYKDYSGRGMYGKKCVGVTCGSAMKLAAAVMEECAGLVGDEDFDMSEIADDFRRASTDSMGRDMIVYFPGVEWEGEDEDDGEDESDEDDARA